MGDFLGGILKNQFHMENEILVTALCRTASFAVTLLAAWVLWKIFCRAIGRYKRRSSDNPKIGTISTILESLLKYIIYFFVFCQALYQLFNVNVVSLLAAAGVVGIALAFGAQSLVEDVITGFFIIFEGEFEVGDVVTIDGFTGTVDKITLRCTTLRSYTGDVYVIPNGDVEKVLNHQKSPRAVSLDAEIAYESDIDTAVRVLKACADKAWSELPQIDGEPQVLGVTELGESGVKIRTLIPCQAGTQYEVEREMLRRVKYAFDENGIEIPYNKVVVIRKDIKDELK